MWQVKERTREIRLATIEAQFQANKQKMRKEILKKQEESSKRHESQLDEIRRKAFEMSILHFSTEDCDSAAPTPVPYERAKYCTHCSVVIKSEVHLKSHLRGRFIWFRAFDAEKLEVSGSQGSDWTFVLQGKNLENNLDEIIKEVLKI